MNAARFQRGIGLVTAIFLLVVLSGMGVAMMSLSTSQQSSAALDLLGARAYQAARAGIEYGVFQELRNNNCPGGPVSFGLPAGTSLSIFTVSVTCVRNTGGGITVRQIRATACNRPSGAGACPNQSNHPDYVQRVLDVQF